jgi:RNA polymerase sigma factor (sigma-70 family)
MDTTDPHPTPGRPDASYPTPPIGLAFRSRRIDPPPDRLITSSVSFQASDTLSSLFREQYAPLLRFCRMRIQQSADAEDIVQEAFLAVARAYPDKSAEELKPLLFTAVRNFSTNFLKSGRYRASRQTTEMTEYASVLACPRTPTPEHLMVSRQQLEAVDQAIAKLPERARTALLLHRQEGMTYQEVADHLRVSPTTVKTDIAGAIAVIARVLTRAETPNLRTTSPCRTVPSARLPSD